jgi:hypothetical protein
MATTDLKLDEQGSLPSPGPVDQIVRRTFGTRGCGTLPA